MTVPYFGATREDLFGAFAEDGVDRASVGRALAVELHTLAEWLGLADVEIGRKGNLVSSTKKAL